MFAKMVGLALLRGLPDLGEVINNLSSWLVWQMSFFIAFPWHRVCPRWVFGLFSAFRVSGFLAGRWISGSNWRCGSPQCWGIIENLPRFFWLILGLIFKFFGVCLVFIFPSQPGWEDTKPRKQNGHTRPFCANAADPGSRGRFCPSSRRLKILLDSQALKILLGTQGPDFPLRSPPCPWHDSAGPRLHKG